MTLEEFKKQFRIVKEKGFIKSIRKGPTGVGHTFERVMGLTENNLSVPDIDGIELKTHRDSSNSMITLLTFNNKAWLMNPLEAIKKYGSLDSKGRLGLYYTLSLTPNSAGLFLLVQKESISVQHTSGETIAEWNLDALQKRFKEKLPALMFVSAFIEERDGIEYFQYYRAQLMQNTNKELLADLFRTGDLLLDLRLHDKGTSARNHGTGFRTFEKKLPKKEGK